MALNPKQTKFVKEYLVDQNATRAAERAGYAGNEQVLGTHGYRLLKNAEIKDQIEKGLAAQTKAIEKRAAKKGVTKERWLAEVAAIAFANMDDFVQIKLVKIYNGHSGKKSFVPTAVPTLTKSRPRKFGKAIKKISETKNGIGLELHSKQAALELLGKHYGWVKEHVEMSGANGGPQVIITIPSNGREASPPKTVQDVQISNEDDASSES